MSTTQRTWMIISNIQDKHKAEKIIIPLQIGQETALFFVLEHCIILMIKFFFF